MRVIVPYDATEPKSRLSGVLTADERHSFARAMLADVLDALQDCGRDPEVLATAPIDVDAPLSIDDRPLTDAVNGALAATDESVATVMADLGLATPDALERLFERDADVVLVPGRSGGTNAFVARHGEFSVDYHGTSIRDHRRIAREIGAGVAEIDSFRLATDVDEPADLAELLLHGDGRASRWLRDHGFEIVLNDERRVRVRRAGWDGATGATDG